MEIIIDRLYSQLSKNVDRKYLRALAFLAFCWTLFRSWKLLKLIEGNLLRKPRNLIERYGTGTYAFIVEPSSSVGRSFCLELAKRSFNLILMGIDQDKMRNIVDECRRLNPHIQAKILLFNVYKAKDGTYYDLLYSYIKNLDISLLIANNISHNDQKLVQSYSQQDILNILFNDCYSLLFIYKKLIPAMIGRPFASGVIIISGIQRLGSQKVSPLLAASKAFRHFLSKSLAIEYTNKIDILVVSPFNFEDVDEEVNYANSESEEDGCKVTVFSSETQILTDTNSPLDKKTTINTETQGKSPEKEDEEKEKNSNRLEICLREKVPIWRRIAAKAFVVTCLKKLSFEKESHGHWKHEILGLLTSKCLENDKNDVRLLDLIEIDKNFICAMLNNKHFLICA